jgi:hypothetical protein
VMTRQTVTRLELKARQRRVLWLVYTLFSLRNAAGLPAARHSCFSSRFLSLLFHHAIQRIVRYEPPTPEPDAR